jgi:site-specific recombinase XerD
MKITDLATRLSDFLGNYLPAQKNASPNTVKAYRDVFVLLLRYCRDERGIPTEQLRIEQINARLILDFLENLEEARGCRKATINQRLAAIHAFFRYLQAEDPERMLHCQRVLCIPLRRNCPPPVNYLSTENLTSVLNAPLLDRPEGRRDAVLLSVLYDSGARAQELVDLTVQDVRLEAPTQIRLTGKGKKTRVVPIMEKTARILKQHIREQRLDSPEKAGEPLFQNRWGRPLTRWGIRYILAKYAKKAGIAQGEHSLKISPHVLRHTKAMHLLQAGNGVIIIRDFLGHADIKSTEIYARADLAMKEEALKKAVGKSPEVRLPSWKQNKGLLEWLKSL